MSCSKIIHLMENGCVDETKYGGYEDYGSSNNHAIMASSYGHKPILVPMKVFTCKYCRRRFLNSRALGGHQNAHKKERTIWMAGMSNHRPLGMEAHGGPSRPVQVDLGTRNTKQCCRRLDEAWRKQMLMEAAYQDLRWPGSFLVCSSEVVVASTNGKRITEASDANGPVLSLQPEQHDLDLDLHL